MIKMNSNIYESNKGLNIKPTARKCIYENCGFCCSQERMGKYGLKNKRSDLSILEQSNDDVDNIMSKVYSKIPNPHHGMLRRHSFKICNDPEDDYNYENSLSKSSPASFSSCSEPWINTSESILEGSVHDRSSSSTHNNSSRHHIETLHNRPLQNSRTTESNNCCSKLIYIIISIFVGVLSTIIYYSYLRNEFQQIDIYDKHSFYKDVKDIGEKYKVQDNSILQVKTGISTIFENQDTGSFLFIYDSNVTNFNPLKLDQFVEDISAKSSKYLRNETKQVHHVVVNPSNLIVHTEKEFMNQYQSDVDKRGVMLVKDVDNIPSHLAMAFHYYCDEYNPLVKKSAVFFTLNLAKCSNRSNRRSTHEYVEKCLARKWNSVEQDKIGPLLARVVNVVIDVTSMW